MRIRSVFSNAIVLHEQGAGLRMTMRQPLNSLKPSELSGFHLVPEVKWQPRASGTDRPFDGGSTGAGDESHDRGTDSVPGPGA